MASFAVNQATTFNQSELINFFYNALVGGSIVYLLAEILALAGFDAFVPYDFGTTLVLYVASFSAIYFLFILTQKYVAGRLGFKAVYTPWIFGPIVGFGFSVMTYGLVPLLYLGTVSVRPVEKIRLGLARKAVNARELAFIASSGILITLVFIVLILEPLYLLTGEGIFQISIVSATALMFYSTLPLPKTNGAYIILYSRLLWVFLLLFTLITFLFVAFVNLITYLLALLITGLIIYTGLKYLDV